MTVLLEKGCTAIAADLRSVLRQIPLRSFRRTLESAFSYMEIIVSGLNTEESRHACLIALMGEWKQFIVTDLVESEYDAMNELLNQVNLNVGRDERIEGFDDVDIAIVMNVEVKMKMNMKI